MTTSPASGSEPPSSSAFERLHPGVQRWIWRRGWRSLRPIQEHAAVPILAGDRDVLITAPTAGGKTEAAFLPIVSRLAAGSETDPDAGLGCLCVSPLKALINDQYRRLQELCDAAGVTVHRWHGDVSGSKKRQVLRGASRLLLITPESMEALFVLRGSQTAALYAGLEYLVVDELHAFLGGPRGRQLQSLLHRLEAAVGRRVPRIGLSATLGDLDLAAELLRPGGGEAVVRVEDDGDGRELRLQIRGYVNRPPKTGAEKEAAEAEGPEDEAPTGSALLDVARHLFAHLRGSDNLVFANSRNRVEQLTDRLRRLCEAAGVPPEFLPHHGNLSRDLREEAEAWLKKAGHPATVVCTSTLELGIDGGNVASVAQVGRPQSVTALRQRLGRSGRRDDDPAVLRIYVQEGQIDSQTQPHDSLRAAVVEATAVVELLLAGWLEPPPVGELQLSTLVQQILSVIAERGGVHPQAAWDLLCRTGPFPGVNRQRFMLLLRELGRREVVSQASDGDLVLGVQGEILVGHYSFYAAFTSPDEYQLRTAGRTLGTMPALMPLVVGHYLIFGGRRWKIVAVDDEARVADLTPAAGGRAPIFGGGPLRVHDRVRREMERLYRGDGVPIYLDPPARRLLAEGRASFRQLGLDQRAVIPFGSGSLLFPWCGDRALHTLTLLLNAGGVDATHEGIAVVVRDVAPEDLLPRLARIAATPPDPLELAARVGNRRSEKYDHLLPDDLLTADYAARALDVPGAVGVLERLAPTP